MKKVLTSAIFISAFALFTACSGSVDSGSNKGFTDPGFASGSVAAKNVVATSYSFTGEACSSSGSTHCHATYYNGQINGIDYQCIAVNDNHIGGDNDFNLKIYRSGSSGNWNVYMRKGTTEYKNETMLEADITPNVSADKATLPANIVINNSKTIGGITIQGTIATQEYSASE